MSAAEAITIPGGTWIDGECHREARLRPLTGADEVIAAELEGLPATRATTLLARCLTRLGPNEEVSPDDVRALTVGDREALLLHLRRVSFGARLQCVFDCGECGEPMDIGLEIGDLLLPPYQDPRSSYEATLGRDGGGERVRFRLPTGTDQETVAHAAHEPQAAASAFARCCTGRGLDADSVEQLSELMLALDPQAETVLALCCPACGSRASVTFDATDFLLRELAEHSRELYREIHLLALYYGWDEAQVLSLPTARRRLYLGLLADSFGEAS